MFRLTFRCRRLLLLPLLLAIFLTSLLTLHNNNSFLRGVFLNYHVSFHGLPGSYLAFRSPNGSYCNYRYGLPEELLYEESDLVTPIEGEPESLRFRVLPNAVEAKLDGELLPGVTYATHVTPDFLGYIAELIRFWEGPISVAAFVPDLDSHSTIKILHQLCSCSAEMGRVSIHLVFPLSSPPYLQNTREDLSCKLPVSSKMATFRAANQLAYPINVCRNVARNLAPTDFVMVSDVQLVPSEGLAWRFVEMLKKFHVKKPQPSRVFVVPVFEVEEFDVIPRSKEELLVMVREERAVYFHRHVCSHCQKFPGIKTWLEGDPGDVIKPFVSVKREFPFHRWEPIFIGSKNEPLYSEALSWEGLQDKMTQVLEMCLIGYQFVILDGAFLVHWPGIQKVRQANQYWRMPFQQENSKHYSRIINRLRETYKDNPKCKLQ